MKPFPAITLALFLSVLQAAEVTVPSGIDHSPYDALLKKYVDAEGLVDYRAWKKSSGDLKALKEYLKQYTPEPDAPAEGGERIAALVNAYNAFTLELILDNFPTKSIRKLDDPFVGKRHRVGGRNVSLDEIEHDTLRPLIGWKVHSLVVCAARSCPPLLNRAYKPETWEETMRERYRAWLAREDLNKFSPEENEARISKIFDWYGGDFQGKNSVKNILDRFGPAEYGDFFSEKKYKIRYLDYHWGLNARSDLGKDYEHGFFKSLF